MSWHQNDWLRLFSLIPQLASIRAQAVDSGMATDHANLATVVAGIGMLAVAPAAAPVPVPPSAG